MDKHYQTLKLGAAAMLGVALILCPNLVTAPPDARFGVALGCFAVSIPVLGFVVVSIFFAEVEAHRNPSVASERLRRFDTVLALATVFGAFTTALGLMFTFYRYSPEHGFTFFLTSAVCVLLWIYLHRD